MSYLKKLHLEAIKSSHHTYKLDEEDDSIIATIFKNNQCAQKSAEITEQVAIDFVEWINNNGYIQANGRGIGQKDKWYDFSQNPIPISTEELFQKFLKEST